MREVEKDTQAAAPDMAEAAHDGSRPPRKAPDFRALSGGGGNRTRVRGRTGQSVYERSLRFDLTRTAGSQATYRRASHPVVSPLRRLAFLRGQPVI